MEEGHRSRETDDDDDHSTDGELDSSECEAEPEFASEMKHVRNNVGQQWAKILAEENLSSMMSTSLVDQNKIIHIDDPIAQQSSDPLNYVFPDGTNVDEYFERKKRIEKGAQQKQKRISRRDLKNLAHILNGEQNHELLLTVMKTIGKSRAFDYARQIIELYKDEASTERQCANGKQRTLGGFYFKSLLSKQETNSWLNENERQQIQRRNQQLQKEKKKERKKLKKTPK